MKASTLILPTIAVCAVAIQTSFASDRVKTANGILESTDAPKDGVRSFKGIPFGQPPVGDLRWREPQPVKNWNGVRKADQFGPRCVQRTSAGADYWFRSNGMSEDCLYLNVWTPAKSGKEKLPVLLYIFGWSHSFKPRLINSANFSISRSRNLTTPFFANSKENIAATLGILGTSQDPINYGPPALSFTNFSSLSDGTPNLSRNQTATFSDNFTWVLKRKHNLTFGFTYNRLQQNSQNY